MVTAGTLEEATEALALCRATPGLYTTVGVHPTRCRAIAEAPAAGGGPDGYVQRLLAVAREGMADGKVVAIGECGLDWDRTRESRRVVCHAAWCARAHTLAQPAGCRGAGATVSCALLARAPT
jgi:Tat protein secretion system quality control protein TatD with DNase activity